MLAKILPVPRSFPRMAVSGQLKGRKLSRIIDPALNFKLYILLTIRIDELKKHYKIRSILFTHS